MMIRDPRARLRVLADQRGVGLGEVSRVIKRSPRYLQRYVREGRPARLREDERDTLSAFFGVPAHELGGHDPRWDKFKVVK